MRKKKKKSAAGGKVTGPSRFTNLWSCFHEWGGPCLQFLSNTRPCVCEGSARGLPALARCPMSTDFPLVQRLMHTTHYIFTFLGGSYAFPQAYNPCNSHLFPIFRLLLPSAWMFFTQRKNKPPHSKARHWCGALVMKGERRKSRLPTCNCKLSCLGNVYLDIQCHTFLGCCCFSLLDHRMVPL